MRLRDPGSDARFRREIRERLADAVRRPPQAGLAARNAFTTPDAAAEAAAGAPAP